MIAILYVVGAAAIGSLIPLVTGLNVWNWQYWPIYILILWLWYMACRKLADRWGWFGFRI